MRLFLFVFARDKVPPPCQTLVKRQATVPLCERASLPVLLLVVACRSRGLLFVIVNFGQWARRGDFVLVR